MPVIFSLVNTGNLLPHGFCINWTPTLLWLYVISDALIVLAYYSIPITLVYFVRHRKDLAFSKIFMMFGAFILACGTTHLLGIITLWHPIYWIDASMKAFTALISLVTAIMLVYLVPKALKLPSPAQLAHEIKERIRAFDALQSSQLTLQESEDRLSLAVHAAGIGIWDWNLQTKQMVWDESMFELYHIKREDFSNAVDAWEKSLHPEDRQRAEHEIQEALNNSKPFNSEFRIVWPNGEVRYIKAAAKVFFSEEGKPLSMLGTNIDITERSLVDRMKSEFIATAAHELRTPMTSIFGYAELLKDMPLDAETQKEIIGTIYKQSKLMVDLLNEVLDVAKMEAHVVNLYDMKLQPIGAILKAVADTLVTPGNVNKVALEISLNLPDVNVDIIRIEHAVKNLLDNAFKFSPNNGVVTVQVSEVMQDKKRKVLIAIQDHGIGMTPEQLKHIYERFYRADQSGYLPGTGLGMAIVREIITHHGGTMEIESKLGVGTKVMLYLPVA